ncbi:hypothetical protein [Frankia sp. R82]|uniref:hypothetical protein n=1 Tax=Frankia sp. R82 TaxID=2950553 RepID=UPI0020449908|nr:hypothetical protein [Frankia sp. R82]
MMIRGLRAAGPYPTRAGFITGLRAVKGYTAGGLTPPVTFEQDFGKPSVCYPLIGINATGTGVDAISNSFCDEHLGNRHLGNRHLGNRGPSALTWR